MTINKILHPKLEFSDLTHGFFTRKGGYSKSPYHSLNCSFNVEDNESDVKKNLTLICKELKLEKLIQLNQIQVIKLDLSQTYFQKYKSFFKSINL